MSKPDSSETPPTANGHEGGGSIAWMAGNPIAANLIMVLLLAGGLWFAFTAQKEVFPEFELDVVTVSVSYPGAAPTEVEQGIILPIEEAVRGIEGVREMTSSSQEGSGSVAIELITGVNRMKVFQDVDQAVSRIRTFPDDIEDPSVRLASRQREVLEIVLYGEINQMDLRVLGERLRDQLRAHPGITQVELSRVRDYVTHVEIPRDTLREYGLTLNQVADIIRNSSEDVAAGTVETASGEILLRMSERKQIASEFGEIEIVSGRDGAVVRLKDIASIEDGFEEAGFPSQFNQQPSIEVNVYRIGNQSPIDIADYVYEEMDAFERQLPEGVNWRIDSNAAEDFRERVGLVVENGLMAILIVMCVLAVFLEIRLAFWVMMGMVISFFGGLLFLPMFGVSINMISLFGFLIVLGIVVDDAIVVGENIYEHRQKGDNPLKAAIDGAREVSGPVIFSILSNIVAFVPLMLIPGTTGKFWEPLPIVVIILLAVSLFEALYILPAHLGHLRRGGVQNAIGQKVYGGQRFFSSAFTHFTNTVFAWFLDRALRNRYIVIALSIALLVIVGAYSKSSHMGMINMPQVSAHEIEAGIRLPVGTTTDQATGIANTVTAATLRMLREQGMETTAEGVKTNVRGQNRFIDVEIVMLPPDERELNANEVIELWRQEIGDLPGVTQITFEAESGPGGARQDISIDLGHNDIDTLEAATQDFLARVKAFSNTRDISDNFNRGKDQLDITLLPEGRALGMTPEYVGQQVRAAFYGDLALRLLRGTNEVEVRVKLPKEQRKDIHNLEELVLLTPSGVEVPLLDVVEVELTEAFSSISRRDGRRVVTVSMDAEPKRAVNQVIEAIREEELPALRDKYPGLTWSFEGSNAEMRESTASLWGGFAFALVIIYSLLAVAFRSYLQPLVVLIAIPFGTVGAVGGHMLLGYDLSLISMMGVVALSGVVVNDSLIMVDFANRHREKDGVFKAIRDAGVRRFRPIILTTVTTFGGLLPIIFETSVQAQYLIPMAISLGFGIVFSTSIILLLVPSLYLVLEQDLKSPSN